MSTERCDHGNVIADTGGNEYRCYECSPFGPDDIADLEQESEELRTEVDQLKASVAALTARIESLERGRP